MVVVGGEQWRSEAEVAKQQQLQAFGQKIRLDILQADDATGCSVSAIDKVATSVCAEWADSNLQKWL
jgi:hypothetical protein